MLDAAAELVREAALRLLANRNWSRSELTERLAARGHRPELVADVLDRLAAVGLLDDAAYARELAGRVLRGGPAAAELLVARLVARGVDEAVATAAAAAALGGEPADSAALRLARASLEAGRKSGTAGAARVAALLRRRGFDCDTIEDTLRRLDLADAATGQEDRS